MAKALVPEENIMYTFVMPKTGRQITYEFCGETDKGRYLMYSEESRMPVSFSKDWFSFLATKCLLKKEIKKEEPKKIDPYVKQEQERKAGVLAYKERSKQEKERYINVLSKFTEKEKIQARQTLGVDIKKLLEELIAELKRGFFNWNCEKAVICDNLERLFPNKPWAI